jgi:hypothetical protein
VASENGAERDEDRANGWAGCAEGVDYAVPGSEVRAVDEREESVFDIGEQDV